MNRFHIATGTMLAAILATAPVAAQDVETSDLDAVRRATAAYHWLPLALDEGFVPFSLEGTDTPTCFESEAGGMGVHYVRNIDDVANATDPEALVYEIEEDGDMRLVAVEYVVPEEFVEDTSGNVVSLPSLHGQDFHKHPSLPMYILHAWIWEENPEGMFADFNPSVRGCPMS